MSWPKWLAPLLLAVPSVLLAALVFFPLNTRLGLTGWKMYAAFYALTFVMVFVWIGVLIVVAQLQSRKQGK